MLGFRRGGRGCCRVLQRDSAAGRWTLRNMRLALRASGMAWMEPTWWVLAQSCSPRREYRWGRKRERDGRDAFVQTTAHKLLSINKPLTRLDATAYVSLMVRTPISLAKECT